MFWDKLSRGGYGKPKITVLKADPGYPHFSENEVETETNMRISSAVRTVESEIRAATNTGPVYPHFPKNLFENDNAIHTSSVVPWGKFSYATVKLQTQFISIFEKS